MKIKVWAEYHKADKRFTGVVLLEGTRPRSVWSSYIYKRCWMTLKEVVRVKKS
jgi:hypothetical protein